MKSIKLYFICSISFYFIVMSSCHKKAQITLPDQSLQKLFGTWNWLESSGGYTGSTINPAKAGYSKQIEFDRDGTFKIYINGKHKGFFKVYDDYKLLQEFKFSFVKEKSIFCGCETYIIKYQSKTFHKGNEDPINQSMSFAGPDTLYLDDECYDCYGHCYVRQR